MDKLIMAVLLCVVCCGYSFAEESEEPTDVATFMMAAENCEHFAGEWDNSLPEENKKMIKQSIAQYCGEAKNKLPELRKKYQDNKHVTEILSNYSY